MASAEVLLTLRDNVSNQLGQTNAAYQALSVRQQQAETRAINYANAQLRAATSDQKLATEEQRTAIQIANKAAAEDRAAIAALRLAAAQDKASSSAGSFAQQIGGAVTSNLVGMLGPAALVTAAFGAIKGAADLAVAGESTNRVTRSFEQLATQAHTTGDALLNALRAASGGQISDLNLELATNKGLLLGVADNAATFADLMTVARDRAAKLGTDATQAFDDITTGIGRESPRILDNLGIIVDADAANKAYAESIGKTVAQLTKAERIHALTNAVIQQGKSGLDANALAVDNNTNAWSRLGVAIENAKNKTGSFLATGFAPAATSIANILNGNLHPAIIDFNASMAESVGFTQAQASELVKGKNAMQLYNDAVAAQYGVQVPANDASAVSISLAGKSADADDRAAAARLNRASATQVLTAEELKLANATALSDQRKGEQTGTDLSARQFDTFSKLRRDRENEDADAAKKDAEKRARQAEQLQKAQNDQRLASATTSAQKIAELERQRAATSDPVERVRLETQIIQERNSRTKTHTSELSKQLGIHESIFDSQNKQIDAQISLNKLSAEGVLKTLDENKKLRTANAILANPNASDEQRQRAQANIDIIAADRAERAQKARELGATAGGTITKTGKLLQSVPGSGDAPIGPPPPGVAGAQPSAAAAAGAPALKLVDQAGRIIAELVGPFIMDDLLKGVRSVAVTK